MSSEYMRTVAGAVKVVDCSALKKSRSCMWATWVRDPFGHGFSLCGWAAAWAFTGAATRRSLLPSRSTCVGCGGGW